MKKKPALIRVQRDNTKGRQFNWVTLRCGNKGTGRKLMAIKVAADNENAHLNAIRTMASLYEKEYRIIYPG